MSSLLACKMGWSAIPYSDGIKLREAGRNFMKFNKAEYNILQMLFFWDSGGAGDVGDAGDAGDVSNQFNEKGLRCPSGQVKPYSEVCPGRHDENKLYE